MRRALAAVLVLSGCALLGWVIAEPRIQAAEAARAQAELVHQVPAGPALRERAGKPDVEGRIPGARPVSPGQALAVLEIPRLGREWRWAAVEGTSPGLIEAGPGHYSGTPLPGAWGNSAFAAHRAGHGDPFIDFDLLRVGDEVVVTQGDVRWVYEITRAPQVVEQTATWVLDPLPGRQLTLTTCWPRYGSEKRMFVRATLASVQQQGAGGTWATVRSLTT